MRNKKHVNTGPELYLFFLIGWMLKGINDLCITLYLYSCEIEKSWLDNFMYKNIYNIVISAIF